MYNVRWKKILILHLMVGVILALLIPTVWHCPVRLLFGFPCPGCGVTRAVLSVLRLDLKAAFQYNPVFPLIILLFLYGIHRQVFRERWKGRWNERLEIVIICVGIAIIIGTYGYRLAAQNSPVMEICPEKGLIPEVFRGICRFWREME